MQKSGSDNAATEKDMAECREAAKEEAVRLYPYGASIPTLGGAGIMMSQQRDTNQRAVAEAGAFQACMQNRGYARPPAAK
jgi:predicted membrane-bound spermidine synthase